MGLPTDSEQVAKAVAVLSIAREPMYALCFDIENPFYGHAKRKNCELRSVSPYAVQGHQTHRRPVGFIPVVCSRCAVA